MARLLRHHGDGDRPRTIAGDLITSYAAMMVLAPLSDWRAGIGHHIHHRPLFSAIIVADWCFV